MKKELIRNVAIIAHVDHGKTTLIDAFIKQCHNFRENQEEMKLTQILDFNDLEREKGITIQAKNTSLIYKDHKINIIDTPGHADFGGEVERTLNMAEGCILLVDAQEGVMPQTRFVLKKALELNLKPIVLINKIDKKLANINKTLNKTQDLFLELATDSAQLEFKTYYAIGREGKVFSEMPQDLNEAGDTRPLLDAIISEIPAPKGDDNAPFQMQISSLDYNEHQGQYIIGKITSGSVSLGQKLASANPDGEIKAKGYVKQIYIKDVLSYKSIESASVGEIIAIGGFEDVSIGDTLCDPENIASLPSIKISPPSLKIKFEANTSPFLGKEGQFPNLKQLQARLEQESKTNVSLTIERSNDGSYYVSGRGELHLAILIEKMRREGYEFQLRKPEVIVKNINGVDNEPIEELYLEFPEEYFAEVSQEVNERKAQLIDIVKDENIYKVFYKITARNLVGLRRILLTSTKGNLIMNNSFLEYQPISEIEERPQKGRLVSTETGKALAYALNTIQDRGDLLIEPSTDVYEGMIIGLNKYDSDINVNPLKAREKSNVRKATGVVTDILLNTPIQLNLEYALVLLRDDEILEVTPKSLRLRKVFLNKLEEYNALKRKKKASK